MSRRIHRGAPAAAFAARYAATGEPLTSQQGTLDHFLTARYCLYAADRRGQLYRGEIDHTAWPLQSAEAELKDSSLTAPLGFSLPDIDPVLHFAKQLEVVAWDLDRLPA